jgi:excisionase family DNA binding protein
MFPLGSDEGAYRTRPIPKEVPMNTTPSSPSSSPSLEPLLRAREVGGILGVSTNTVLDWAEAGKLPSFKLGAPGGTGPRRFRASEIAAWIERHRAVVVEVDVEVVETVEAVRGA